MDQKIDAMKEYLVALPLFGTTLAISFDVGYFHSLGSTLFGLFSVSEHIAFAMQAVPFLVVASIIMIVVSIIEEHLKQNTEKRPLIEGGLFFVLIMGAFTAFVASHAFGFQVVSLNYAIAVSVLSALAIFLIRRGFISQESFKYNVLVLGTATMLVFGALAVGRDVAHIQTNHRAQTYSIKLNEDQKIKARILRSGERGVLILKVETGEISLIAWEEVKGITQLARQDRKWRNL